MEGLRERRALPVLQDLGSEADLLAKPIIAGFIESERLY